MYDFPGTGYPPLSEHQPLLVPSSWKFIKQKNITVGLFFELFEKSIDADAQVLSLSLQCLTWLVTLKRSMFVSIDERREFLGYFMDGIISILSLSNSSPGHSSPFQIEEVYHGVCRLLDHTRCSFPFTDFILSPSFETWIERVHSFTVNALSFVQGSAFHSGQTYLLDLWSPMASNSLKPTAVLQIHPSKAELNARMSLLSKLTHSVAMSFVDSKLRIAELVSRDDLGIEDPLLEGAPSEFASLSMLIRPQVISGIGFGNHISSI